MSDFAWPDGNQCAVCLTFDDARESQLDHGLPILDEFGVAATFYITPSALERRRDEWIAAAQRHEIGNHTYSHPCSCQYSFSSSNGLEDYDLPRMAADIDRASAYIAEAIGRPPTTFAYPCGQDWVGRGAEHRSYVPLIAERFRAGRIYYLELANQPLKCDPHRLAAHNFDGLSPERALDLLAAGRQTGSLIVFAGHAIGADPGRQIVQTDTLRAVCSWSQDPANGAWITTLENATTHILETR